MNIDNFAIIIGAMKSGTTSLFYYLAEHPEIAPIEGIEGKEPHFFSYENNFNRGMEWYRNKWNFQPEHKIALEGSTTYAMYPKYGNVAGRIASVKNANFKFIYVVRNPFKRIESHIVHLLAGGHLKQPEITEEHLSYTEYAKQLNQFTEVFGRNSIHVLCLEDLQSNPQFELIRICNFLEIDDSFQFQRINTVRNSKQTLNINPTLRKLYQIPAIKYLSKIFSPEFRQNFYGVFSRNQSYSVSLSESDRQLILDRLQPDLIELREKYQLDIADKWGIVFDRSIADI